MGDNIYKWYVASSFDDEVYAGKYDDRESALASAKAEYGDAPFVLIEADKTVVKPTVRPGFFIDQILEDLEEGNPECWGEDGADGAWGDLGALDKAIEKAVADWLLAHPPKTFAVDQFRTIEGFNGAPTE